MSIVCYLRKKVWERSKGMSAAESKKHLDLLKTINKAEYTKCKNNATKKRVIKKKSKLNTRKCK